MRHCSYIYDAEGMRWEDGNVLVDLLVDGTPRTFAVVRSGQGRSRVERFTDTPHRLDRETRKVSGEITAADLQRIIDDGSFTVRGFSTTAGATVEMSAGHTRRDDATIEVVAVSEHGEFLTRIAPKRCVGAGGRETSVETLRGAFERLDDDTRQALALSQIDTMPKSGRAGGPAAVQRLAVALEYVPTRAFLERSELHPSALLHLAPQSWALLAGRTDPRDRVALDALRTRAIRERGEEHSVVLTLDALAEGAGQPVGSELRERLARELTHNHGVSRSLELLIEHSPTQQVLDLLAQALTKDPATIYTSDLMLMLSRIGNETAHAVIGHVIDGHATTLALSDRTMRVLDETLRKAVIDRAPLEALERSVLDDAELERACAMLHTLIRSDSFDDDAMVAKRIDALVPKIRTRVLERLTADETTRHSMVVVTGARRFEAERRARLRGTLRELQRLTQTLTKDVAVLGTALRMAGDSCIEQGRAASLAMLSVRHSGMADPNADARLERGRRNLDHDIRERRQVIARRLNDLDAGMLLLEGHIDDLASLGAMREALTSLRAWYGRQSTDIDSIRYPRSTAERARLNGVGRDLIELGERLPNEINARAHDVSRMLDALVPHA